MDSQVLGDGYGAGACTATGRNACRYIKGNPVSNIEMNAIYAVIILISCWAPLAEASSFPGTSTDEQSFRDIEKRGFDHFYSLEYDEALIEFQRLREAEPNNPAVQNHLAAIYFYKQLLAAGILQGNSFSDTSSVFRGKKIQPERELEKGFHEANQTATRICEQRLKSDRRDQEALYACGVAYAAKSSYEGLIERAKLDALSDGRKASFFHLELFRLNPQFYDAQLVPGLYDFIVGSLPPSLKFLLLLGGFSGDKERGMLEVESAAAQGQRANQDAKIMLAVIYRRAKRYDDARRTLGELVQAYPRNYIFPLEIASIYGRAGQPKEAIAAYEQVLDEIRQGKPGFTEAPAARIHYELAVIYSNTGDMASAKAHLEKISGSHGSTPDLEKQTAELRQRIEGNSVSR